MKFNMSYVTELTVQFHERHGYAYTIYSLGKASLIHPYFESQMKGYVIKERKTQVEIE